ncbi:MAG TPA: hypothetical protein VGY54_04410 [Polyangiaceae bacterium]|jgi:hypothetical protein|nr:hypothetical protein [Polyangiaceae bacterium]
MSPAATGSQPRSQWAFPTRAAVLPIVLCASCYYYSPGGTYVGTGSFAVSGEAESQLASHTIEFVDCTDNNPDEEPRPSFSILAIGEQCVIDGIGWPSVFQPDGGSVCKLAFQEGTHTVRVTDIRASGGMGKHAWGGFAIDLGGDDEATGRHSVYRFSGRSASRPEDRARCSKERPRHEQYLSQVQGAQPVVPPSPPPTGY